MERERNRAVRAARLPAAIPANNEWGISTPVEEENGLMPLLQGLRKPVVKVLAEQSGMARTVALAEVVDMDFGELCARSALGQNEKRVTFLVCLPKALDAWCGRTENDWAAVESAKLKRKRLRVVAGGRLLLEAAFVLLVQNDEADVVKWGKQGAAST